MGAVKLVEPITELAFTRSRPRWAFVPDRCYLSPERLEGRAYDKAVDTWSLGIVAYQVATCGGYPFDESTGQWGLMMQVSSGVAQLLSPGEEVSLQLCSFYDQCMRADPVERPMAGELLGHPLFKGTDAYGAERFADWLCA